MKYKYAILQGWQDECFLLNPRFLTLVAAREARRTRAKTFPTIPWMTIINLKTGKEA